MFQSCDTRGVKHHPNYTGPNYLRPSPGGSSCLAADVGVTFETLFLAGCPGLVGVSCMNACRCDQVRLHTISLAGNTTHGEVQSKRSRSPTVDVPVIGYIITTISIIAKSRYAPLSQQLSQKEKIPLLQISCCRRSHRYHRRSHHHLSVVCLAIELIQRLGSA